VISSVSPEAELELTEGAIFYARDGDVELGLAFIAEFEHTLDLLCNYPELGPVWRGTTRRFPLRRFPYSLVYQVKTDELRVIALAHHRQKPGYWRGRK